MGQYRTEIGTAEVCDMLCRLGATANYRGFSYTAYAVLLCVQQQDRLLLVTKWLYPDVAKRYGTNWKAVERNIRTVITVVWEQNRAMLEGLARRPLLQRPCAAQFLSILSNSLLCEQRAGPVQSGGRRRSGGRGSSDNALFPPCGDLLRCKAEGLVDLIVVLAQQGSAAPHIGVRL